MLKVGLLSEPYKFNGKKLYLLFPAIFTPGYIYRSFITFKVPCHVNLDNGITTGAVKKI